MSKIPYWYVTFEGHIWVRAKDYRHANRKFLKISKDYKGIFRLNGTCLDGKKLKVGKQTEI